MKLEKPIKGAEPLDLDGGGRVSAGFGEAFVQRDGKDYWREKSTDEWWDCPTFADIEAVAAAGPEQDWRIIIRSPLSEERWQRHGPGRWLCYFKGEGFA